MGAEQSRCAAHGVARALCEYRAAAWGRVSASVANGSWRVHSEHAPYLLQGGFGERALLGAKRCAFGVEPHGAFLFWAELLQSQAHTHKLNQLPPIGRFAVNHASILPPAGRNLPQGREQRKCLPRFGQRAGVASAGSSCRSEIEYTPRAFGFLLIALTIQPEQSGLPVALRETGDGLRPTDSRDSAESSRRWKRTMLGIDARRLQRAVVVSRVGVEPTTHGLKVRCSTAELPAHGKEYTQREGEIASEGTVSKNR